MDHGPVLIESILYEIGDDPTRDGLIDTPKRVLNSWKELYSGYEAEKDLPNLLTVFEEPCNQMVMVRDVEFYSTCEHHMLPFYGRASIAYMPADNRVAGVSKLVRVLEVYSRRLQIQERISRQVTEALMKYLQPCGAACTIEAVHLCMVCRGVRKQHSEMVTTSLVGCFETNSLVRQEYLSYIAMRR